MQMDYYKILEVTRTATHDQIKKSYRRLAKKYHPDRNNGRQDYAERFKLINNAYETLSDPAVRAAYDRRFGPDIPSSTEQTRQAYRRWQEKSGKGPEQEQKRPDQKREEAADSAPFSGRWEPPPINLRPLVLFGTFLFVQCGFQVAKFNARSRATKQPEQEQVVAQPEVRQPSQSFRRKHREYKRDEDKMASPAALVSPKPAAHEDEAALIAKMDKAARAENPQLCKDLSHDFVRLYYTHEDAIVAKYYGLWASYRLGDYVAAQEFFTEIYARRADPGRLEPQALASSMEMGLRLAMLRDDAGAYHAIKDEALALSKAFSDTHARIADLIDLAQKSGY